MVWDNYSSHTDENDSPEEIKQECDWILRILVTVFLYISQAFHPDFKMRDKERTPERTLTMQEKIAMDLGIKYCYVGNIHNTEGQTTYCPNCKEKTD